MRIQKIRSIFALAKKEQRSFEFFFIFASIAQLARARDL
ncbi:protein of unknown function [Chryseobacterium sp. JV274]|nr:protein of unknown function [Chryseobacterium sp. JV274]